MLVTLAGATLPSPLSIGDLSHELRAFAAGGSPQLRLARHALFLVEQQPLEFSRVLRAVSYTPPAYTRYEDTVSWWNQLLLQAGEATLQLRVIGVMAADHPGMVGTPVHWVAASKELLDRFEERQTSTFEDHITRVADSLRASLEQMQVQTTGQGACDRVQFKLFRRA